MIDTFGTNEVDEAAIERAVGEVFDLRPGAIIDELDLRRPIYRKTAAYGHFGRELPEFTWERTDKRRRAAEGLRAGLGCSSNVPFSANARRSCLRRVFSYFCK